MQLGTTKLQHGYYIIYFNHKLQGVSENLPTGQAYQFTSYKLQAFSSAQNALSALWVNIQITILNAGL